MKSRPPKSPEKRKELAARKKVRELYLETRYPIRGKQEKKSELLDVYFATKPGTPEALAALKTYRDLAEK